ncbi:hypothetical protein VHEMI09314 [[Torrubiella] hemipterigena]|uniref:Increased loss of mitochondrial DNA protein 1 n=1 Tax=[Torrubiella] hemipterigena TaxID=1531966 RepID=A0A0A1TG34_9HYPO|nr:hypothetical protein VHEMI09314 [[Torrubiella] hemipterigena]
MAFITANTLITSISLFHITIAYFLITNPRTISDQVFVYILGESMTMPPVRDFDTPSPSLSFLAVFLAFCGLSDLVSLSMPEELGALYYWGTQAPFRCFLSFLSVTFSYLFSPFSPLMTMSRTSRNPAYTFKHGASSGLDGLKNRVFFTFMFIEMITWFWIWITLREERAGVVDRLRKKQSREQH